MGDLFVRIRCGVGTSILSYLHFGLYPMSEAIKRLSSHLHNVARADLFEVVARQEPADGEKKWNGAICAHSTPHSCAIHVQTQRAQATPLTHPSISLGTLCRSITC